MADLNQNSNFRKPVPEKGMVIEALPSAFFKIRLEDGREMIAHLAGKLKINHIRILPGDRVLVELGPDGKRGRIVRRL